MNKLKYNLIYRLFTVIFLVSFCVNISADRVIVVNNCGKTLLVGLSTEKEKHELLSSELNIIKYVDFEKGEKVLVRGESWRGELLPGGESCIFGSDKKSNYIIEKNGDYIILINKSQGNKTIGGVIEVQIKSVDKDNMKKLCHVILEVIPELNKAVCLNEDQIEDIDEKTIVNIQKYIKIFNDSEKNFEFIASAYKSLSPKVKELNKKLSDIYIVKRLQLCETKQPIICEIKLAVMDRIDEIILKKDSETNLFKMPELYLKWQKTHINYIEDLKFIADSLCKNEKYKLNKVILSEVVKKCDLFISLKKIIALKDEEIKKIDEKDIKIFIEEVKKVNILDSNFKLISPFFERMFNKVQLLEPKFEKELKERKELLDEKAKQEEIKRNSLLEEKVRFFGREEFKMSKEEAAICMATINSILSKKTQIDPIKDKSSDLIFIKNIKKVSQNLNKDKDYASKIEDLNNISNRCKKIIERSKKIKKAL